MMSHQEQPRQFPPPRPRGPEEATNSPNSPRQRPPSAARSARQQRLRQMSSLRQKAAAQKYLEHRRNDDYESDMRYTSYSLEGMLLTIPSAGGGGGKIGISGSRVAVRTTCRRMYTAVRATATLTAAAAATSPRRGLRRTASSDSHESSGDVSSLGASRFDDDDDSSSSSSIVEDDMEEVVRPSSPTAVAAPPAVAVLNASPSFEQIKDDIDNFKREAAAAVSAAAAHGPRRNNGKDDKDQEGQDEKDKEEDETPSLTTSSFSISSDVSERSDEVESTSSRVIDEVLGGRSIAEGGSDAAEAPAATVDDEAALPDVPHLLGGGDVDDAPHDEIGQVPPETPPVPTSAAATAVAATSTTDSAGRYEEFKGIYHTPDVSLEEELEEDNAATSSTRVAVLHHEEQASTDQDTASTLSIAKIKAAAGTSNCGLPPPRKEKPPLTAVRSPFYSVDGDSSSDDGNDVGDLPSLASPNTPLQVSFAGTYASSNATDKQDCSTEDTGADDSRPLSPCSMHSTFDITVTEVDDLPFDEGCKVAEDENANEEEQPFDEYHGLNTIRPMGGGGCDEEQRSISPLSHPYPNRHKLHARPSTKQPSRHHRDLSAMSELNYSLPDNDHIIDFDPTMLDKSMLSATVTTEADPTFMESLSYTRDTKSDGRMSPETDRTGGIRLNSRGRKSPPSCFVSDAEEDEPSI